MTEGGEGVRLEQRLTGAMIQGDALFEHGPRFLGPVQLRERHAEAVQDEPFLFRVRQFAREEQCGLVVRRAHQQTDPGSIPECRACCGSAIARPHSPSVDARSSAAANAATLASVAPWT